MTATTVTFSGGTDAQQAIQAPVTGVAIGAVRTWLRLEGLAAFVTGLVLFGVSGGNWLLIIPLLLLPDVSAIGYLAGPRVGALTYNLVHTWAPGFVALGIGFWLDAPGVLLIGAVLIAHVGMDRALGYGLKLPSSFQDTHLGRIGRPKA